MKTLATSNRHSVFPSALHGGIESRCFTLTKSQRRARDGKRRIPFQPEILILIFLFCCAILNAQEIPDNETGYKNIRKNSVYFEFLGNGVVYSLNYDRIFPLSEKLALTARIGGSEYHGSETDTLNFNIIMGAGILYGVKKHYFESGLVYTGMTYFPDNLISVVAGYRFMGLKGFVIRVTPMYIYNTEKGDTFGNSLWVGFSLGYSF